MPTAETQELFELAEYVLQQLALLLSRETDTDVCVRVVISHE